MGFRTVVIRKKAYLSTSENNLIVKNDEIKKLHLDDIDNIIIENDQCTITLKLLNKLSDKNICVTICDSYHNPNLVINRLYGNSRRSKRLNKQISWSDNRKDQLWQILVKRKIKTQLNNLCEIQKYSHKLEQYIENVQIKDITNREAVAAKTYFKEFFGDSFKRGEEDSINLALNYGYSILLASINRIILSKGYMLELGIHHINEYNKFNLSCDMIEPFRYIVDMYVKKSKHYVFTKEYRDYLCTIFNHKVTYNGNKLYLNAAIDKYLGNIFAYLNGEQDKVNFCLEDYEL